MNPTLVLGGLGAWRFEGLVGGKGRHCPVEQGRSSSSAAGGRYRTAHCLWPWRNVQSTGGHKEWKFSALQGGREASWKLCELGVKGWVVFRQKIQGSTQPRQRYQLSQAPRYRGLLLGSRE